MKRSTHCSVPFLEAHRGIQPVCARHGQHSKQTECQHATLWCFAPNCPCMHAMPAVETAAVLRLVHELLREPVADAHPVVRCHRMDSLHIGCATTGHTCRSHRAGRMQPLHLHGMHSHQVACSASALQPNTPSNMDPYWALACTTSASSDTQFDSIGYEA